MMYGREDEVSLARIKAHEELEEELVNGAVLIESDHRKALMMRGRQVDDLLASIKEHGDLEKEMAECAVLISNILKRGESKSAGACPSLNTNAPLQKLATVLYISLNARDDMPVFV